MKYDAVTSTLRHVLQLLELTGRLGRLAGGLVVLLAAIVVSTGALPPLGVGVATDEVSLGVDVGDGVGTRGEGERSASSERDDDERDDERDDDERDDEDPLADAAPCEHDDLGGVDGWSLQARLARRPHASEDRSLSAHTRTIERPPHA